jgi:cyclopropane fatty-acyl-phospholipid synthase-like methyltransferase
LSEMVEKPYSEASARNAEPILAVLRKHFADRRAVLEIGSGSGQHAVHFAAALPHLTWHSSDRAMNLPGIRAWLADAKLANTPEPFEFDVDASWPSGRYDAAFSANALHIMSWPQVERLFAGLPALLINNALFAVYGPFHYDGQPTAPSNAQFDAMLRARDPVMGVRDARDVDRIAALAGFALVDDIEMPANNRCRLWRLQR